MLRSALAALLLAAALPALAATSAADANRLLNRIGYGPAPGDLAQVQAMGIGAYIDQQLAPERLAEPAALTDRLAGLDTLGESPAALFRDYGTPAKRALREAGDDPEKQKAALQALRKEAGKVPLQAQTARLLRAVESPRQLQEVMTEFWFNHFNVFAGKGLDRIWVGTYERDAIRPYALGRFRDLLGATAKHPAMLFYLDNWRSTYNGFQPGGRRGARAGRATTGLNENYARELMELHTLGVDGGYTQQDVTELARILTGWTYDPREMADGDDRAGFVFADARHDDGHKQFLGQRFDNDGQAEGERALDLLAASPATAHHLAFELCQFFIADQPPPALVEKVAARFASSGGDLRETLRVLLHDPALLDPANTKFKTPYQYVVSALRASGEPLARPRPALQALRQLGQPVYGWATPNGYGNTEADWLSPNGLLLRASFATALGTARTPPPSTAADDDDTANAMPAATTAAPAPADKPLASPLAQPLPSFEVLQTTLALPLSPATQAAIREAPVAARSGLLLGSPEFMRR